MRVVKLGECCAIQLCGAVVWCGVVLWRAVFVVLSAFMSACRSCISKEDENANAGRGMGHGGVYGGSRMAVACVLPRTCSRAYDIAY
jgi:hypothetical protein